MTISSFRTRFLFCLIGVVLLAGCSSKKSDSGETATQAVVFWNFQLQLPVSYTISPSSDWIDPRISKKIDAVYYSNEDASYTNNIVVFSDKLSPNAALEDYVQASLEGIASTWGSYESLWSTKSSLHCQALTIPTIQHNFSIYRVSPKDKSWETLYFSQYYLHHLSDIAVVSASSSSKSALSALQKIIASITCNYGWQA